MTILCVAMAYVSLGLMALFAANGLPEYEFEALVLFFACLVLAFATKRRPASRVHLAPQRERVTVRLKVIK